MTAPSLLGSAEVAELLAITTERAEELSRTPGFPEPVRLVVPIDDFARRGMVHFLGTEPITTDAERAFTMLMRRAHSLPDHPRLWRRRAVVAWALTNGQQVTNTDEVLETT
jgi:hypothetical protein